MSTNSDDSFAQSCGLQILFGVVPVEEFGFDPNARSWRSIIKCQFRLFDTKS